jgi:hypothetical protein
MSNFYSFFFFHTSDTLRKDIRHYDVITELQNPSNELIQIFSEELDLNEYWLDLMQRLSLLFGIALDYIWLPISSCSVERSFFMYNSLLSLKSLSILYYNSS